MLFAIFEAFGYSYFIKKLFFDWSYIYKKFKLGKNIGQFVYFGVNFCLFLE